MQMGTKRIGELVIGLLRKDFFTTGSTGRDFQLRDRKCMHAPVVPEFGVVAYSPHDDLVFEAVMALPGKGFLRGKGSFRHFWMTIVHGYSPLRSRIRPEPPEAGISGAFQCRPVCHES